MCVCVCILQLPSNRLYHASTKKKQCAFYVNFRHRTFIFPVNSGIAFACDVMRQLHEAVNKLGNVCRTEYFGAFTLLLSVDVKAMNIFKRLMLSILRQCRFTFYLSNRFTIDHHHIISRGGFSRYLLQFITPHLQLIMLDAHLFCHFQYILHRKH